MLRYQQQQQMVIKQQQKTSREKIELTVAGIEPATCLFCNKYNVVNCSCILTSVATVFLLAHFIKSLPVDVVFLSMHSRFRSVAFENLL